MSALAESPVQAYRKAAIKQAVRDAFAAFDPQSINHETIASEVMTAMPDCLHTDLYRVVGSMCGEKEILFGQEDFTWESSPGVFETEIIITYKLNKFP